MADAIENMVKDLNGRDFVVFVGAGVSKPTGVQDWKGILLKLYEIAPISGLNIKDLPSFLYPEAAQMMYESLSRQGRVDEYYSVIEKKLDSSECRWHSVQWNITGACSSIITTNLDTTFEDAINDRIKDSVPARCCEFQALGNLSLDSLKKSNHITYLHGRRGSREIILKTADYVKHYSSLNGGNESELEKILSSMFAGETAMVFIGVSFDDRYVLGTFERVYRSEVKKIGGKGDKSIKHYAIMGEVAEKSIRDKLRLDGKTSDENELDILNKIREADSLEERLGKINIEVVRYEYDQHKRLDYIFEAISKKSVISKNKTDEVPEKE